MRDGSGGPVEVELGALEAVVKAVDRSACAAIHRLVHRPSIAHQPWLTVFVSVTVTLAVGEDDGWLVS